MKTILCRSGDDTRIGVLKALIAFAFAVVIQSLLTTGRIELPQKNGESLLSLISDDTRMVLSFSMMKKADEYFHGGVRAADCTLEKHAAEELTGEPDHDHDHEHSLSQHEISSQEALKKPFLWINSQIHAQEHRHLKYGRSVELLPWVSAAVMASPHNIQAYESGSYILHRMTEKPQLAVNFLKDGIKNNPESPVLETTLGELFYNSIKDKEPAAIHFERALEKSLKQKGELNTDDRFLRLKICFYIGLAARDTHDAVKLRSVYELAREIKPDNIMTVSLAGWLAEEEIRSKE